MNITRTGKRGPLLGFCATCLYIGKTSQFSHGIARSSLVGLMGGAVSAHHALRLVPDNSCHQVFSSICNPEPAFLSANQWNSLHLLHSQTWFLAQDRNVFHVSGTAPFPPYFSAMPAPSSTLPGSWTESRAAWILQWETTQWGLRQGLSPVHHKSSWTAALW